MKFREKTTAILLIAIFMISTCANLPTFAADEDEIEESIVAGLAWLAEQQNDDDGSWGDYEHTGHTGLAVLKFIDRAKELGEDPFGDDYDYQSQVENGLKFIFEHVNEISIGPQNGNDPDSDGDGIGIIISDNYATGICLMAISAAKPYAPGNVPTGPYTGETYADVITDTVDYLAWCQNDYGPERGGWGYSPWFLGSDNSVSGYVTLGLGYAIASGATVPQFVLDELDIWIDYIQTDVDGDTDDGGSGYSQPDDWVNMLKTGNLLYQMALVGDTIDTPRVIDAIDYQERHWNDADWDPGWKGPSWWGEDWADHQATFCIMKGFEAFGIDLIDLDGNDIPEHDWFDDISTRIVQTQNTDDYWFYDNWGDAILSTTWALLTLEKTVAIPLTSVSVDIKPGSWPNPINKGSNGVFSVAICGTDEFDVTTIDPETVMIHVEGVDEGVYPLRWSYEDAATPYTGELGGGHELEGDNYTDLVLHFDTQEVVEALELCIYDDETIPLIIRGHLLDEEGETALEGQDYVWLKTPRGLGKGQDVPPPFLKGNRINVYPDEVDVEIPVDEHSFVSHGWSMDSWKDLSKEEQNTYKEKHWFKLYIDDDPEPVELKEWNKYYKTLGEEQDVMLLLFNIQFKPNSFAPGTYTFKGEWWDGSTLFYRQIEVTFIP